MRFLTVTAESLCVTVILYQHVPLSDVDITSNGIMAWAVRYEKILIFLEISPELPETAQCFNWFYVFQTIPINYFCMLEALKVLDYWEGITSLCGHLTYMETLWKLWNEGRIDPMEMFCSRHHFFLCVIGYATSLYPVMIYFINICCNTCWITDISLRSLLILQSTFRATTPFHIIPGIIRGSI